MRMRPWKSIVVGILWVSALLFLAFFYTDIANYGLRTIPYSFVLLTPFGLMSFFGWVIALAASFWAVHALGWNEQSLGPTVKWLVVFACGIVLLHAAWVVFVVARGGL